MNTKQFLLFPGILLFGVFAANAQNSKINSDYHPLVQEGKVWSVVLDVSGITGGIYFIRLFSSKGDIVKKVIVKK